MRKTLGKINLGIITFLSAFPIFSTTAMAQVRDWESRGLNCTGINSGLAEAGDVATIQGFSCLIANLLSIAITGIGLLAFVMFVIASFRYLVAGGNSKNVELAKGTMTYAIVGIVVALSSFIILNLISNFTGINVTEFIIPQASTTIVP